MGRKRLNVIILAAFAALTAIALWHVTRPTLHSSVSIKPGQGVAGIMFGDTRTSIEEAFGPPDSVTANGLFYADLGLAFYLSSGQTLNAAAAFTTESNLAVTSSFSGTLSGKIQMYDDLASAVSTFGPPDNIEEAGGQKKVEWKQLGLTLHFFNDDLLNVYVVQVVGEAEISQ